MRLGELLIGENLISLEQLAAALRLQSQLKQRLGTCLATLGFVDVDTLARALSGQQRVPAVLTKHFAHVEPNVIKLFTPRFAAEHHAIPLGYTQAKPARLVVACRDPLTAPLDEIAFMAGTRVDAGIAPELSIRRCLEKYYAVATKTDQKFVEVDVAAMYSRSSMPPADAREMPQTTHAVLPAPPRMPAPAAVAAPMPAEPRPAPGAMSLSAPPRPMLSAPPPPMHAEEEPRRDEKRRFDQPALDVPAPIAAALVDVPLPIEEPLRVDEPFHAEADIAPPSARAWDDPDAWEPAPPRVMTAPAGALHRVLGLEEAVAALRVATARDEIGDVLADYLRSAFGCGLVLIVKSGMALGWKGFAPDAEPELIESIAMPLGAPSMLATAYEQLSTFRGVPPNDGKALQTRLWKVLRCEPPDEVVVAPIIVAKRIVNLLYAHAEGIAELPASASVDLNELAAVASGEFIRIIRSKK